MREAREALLVPLADQRLAPRRDEDAGLEIAQRRDAIGEALPLLAVGGELLARVLALRERAVRAAEVAARERSSIEDVEALHVSSYVDIRWLTASV
jgi:hypothetical protein